MLVSNSRVIFMPGVGLTHLEILGNPQREAFVQKQTDVTSTTSRAEARRHEIAARARIVFGSKLAGPIQRKQRIAEASKVVAGVVVPPRPEEPDNCCMSGCVNCVWDQFRDDLEDWAAKSAEARAALEKQRATRPGKAAKVKGHGSSIPEAMSMDDDGGGSETNWDVDLGTAGASAEDYFKNIPVGIREFMKTEKRLKELHRP